MQYLWSSSSLEYLACENLLLHNNNTQQQQNSSGVHMGSWKTAMAFADLESENLEEERAK